MHAPGGVSIFDGLPADELRAELDGLKRQEFEAGAVLIATGDRAHRLMLVESGSADVFVADRHGVEHRVGGAVAGSILGEMALLTNEPSACTVRAATKVEATVLEPADFDRIAARFPSIYRNLGTILARKLVQADRLAAGDTLGRLVLVHDRGGPPLAAYALACSIAWHTRDSVLLMARDRGGYRELADLGVSPDGERAGVDRAHAMVEEAGDDGTLRAEIDSLFGRYATILVLDRKIPALLQPATEIELVDAGATVGDDPEAMTIRAWRTSPSPRPDLTGCHDVPPLEPSEEASIRGGLLSTEVWAGEALGRLARRLTGLTVGVALGSGSIRGYAHFGVLSGLEKAGIVPDLLAGTSVGAAAATLHAMGDNPTEGAKVFDDFSERMFRVTLPGRGLLSNAGMRSFLQNYCGERRIEDLPVPLAIVAADLASQAEVVFRRGVLWQAVLASISIPGVYAAQRLGPYMLVDGGVINPVPTSVAGAMGAGIVLSVRLVGSRELSNPYAEAMPAQGRPASAVAAIMHSIEIMQGRLDHHAPADVTSIAITPEFDHLPATKLRHFRSGRVHFATGEKAVEAALPRIAAALPWLRP